MRSERFCSFLLYIHILISISITHGLFETLFQQQSVLIRQRLLQFFKGYDRLLSRYMRHGEGIGQDLTLVTMLIVCMPSKPCAT